MHSCTDKDNRTMTGDILDQTTPFTRPSPLQNTALIEFMRKHPDLIHKKERCMVDRFKNLWNEISSTLNSLEGIQKTTNGWIKYWTIKKRTIMLKLKDVKDGKLSGRQLTSTELVILDLCRNKPSKGGRNFRKYENVDGEIKSSTDDISHTVLNSQYSVSTKTQENNIKIMEKILCVMEQQGRAMTALAKASVINSVAVAKIAEARHTQALAVDKAANTFENINSSLYDVRNAVTSIDHALKT